MNKRAMVIGILVILLFSAMAVGIHGAGVHKNMKEKIRAILGRLWRLRARNTQPTM